MTTLTSAITRNESSLQVLTVLGKISQKNSLLDASKKLNIQDDVFSKWGGFSMETFQKTISPGCIKEMLAENSAEEANHVNIRLKKIVRSNLSHTIIKYTFFDRSAFGPGLVASTDFGICYLGFEAVSSDPTSSKIFLDMTERFKEAACFENEETKQHLQVIDYLKFEQAQQHLDMNVHVLGSEFQIEVWKSLLLIPKGSLSTYGKISSTIGKPRAFRAVGSAIGRNPVSYFIPCHRVINSSGEIGNYMWGSNVKKAMIGFDKLFN